MGRSFRSNWRDLVRIRYRRKGWRAVFWLAALALACLVTSSLAGWAWILTLNVDPSWDLIGGTLFLAETPLFIWLARKRPALNMPGESPEALAADQFFRDRD